MTQKEKKRKKKEYLQKITQNRGISPIMASQLAIVKEYNKYVNTIKEISGPYGR